MEMISAFLDVRFVVYRPHQSKAVILMKHCHCHPMNCFTPMKLFHAIYDVYNQLMILLKNGKSAAGALHEYTIKTIQNKGKNHYLKLMDSGVKSDVEFVYELYYSHIRKSKFSSPLVKRVDSLTESIKYYNASTGTKSVVVELIKNNIVVAIRTPLMGSINTDEVFVCSTSFDKCKTWFMFSKNDKNIMIPKIDRRSLCALSISNILILTLANFSFTKSIFGVRLHF